MTVSQIGRRFARTVRSASVALVALGLVACASGPAGAQSASDDALAARVADALENASDLPTDAFAVTATDDGVVRITGSVVCESCPGMQTPGGIQSVQQSLGAIVRAVPGVERVEFDLEYEP